MTNIGLATLQPGQTTTFVVRMDATTAGSYSGVIRFANNDADEATYDINVSGTVVAPEVTVLLEGADFADGASTPFGTTNLGTYVDKTFTIRNDGSAALTLQQIDTTNLPAGFSIVTNIGSASLQPGETTTFVVRMDATVVGSYSGVIRFANNDADEATYDINVSGTVVAPEVTVLLGGTDFADGGSTSFGTTDVGTFVDQTFTIRNDGSAALTLQQIDTTTLPAGFSIVTNIGLATLQPGQTTTFVVRMDATAAGSYSGVIRFTSNDADEATYDINVSGTVVPPPTPEVMVLLGGTDFADGGSISFGTTNLGTYVDKTLTIRNDGNAALTLQQIDTTTLPAGFSIVTNIGSASLQPGETTTFVVRMDATVVGSYSGVIRFTSNDADEATYDINVSGTVVTPEVTVRLGGTDFADGGSTSFGTTYVGTFVDRTFTIRNDGSAALTLQQIDTTTLPAGFSIVTNIGSASLQAGETTTFVVRMDATAAGSYSGVIQFISNDADEATYDINVSGTVVTPPPSTGQPEITILDGTKEIISWTTQASFGRIDAGTYVDKTFTIRNDGTGVLTLQSIDLTTLPAWLSIVSNINVGSLQPGSSTTFTVRFNPATAGTYTGSVKVRSNDANESTYVIQLIGMAATAPVAAATPEQSVTATSPNLALIDEVMAQFGTTKKSGR